MNNSMPGSNEIGSADILSIETQFSSLAVHSASGDISQPMDLVEASCKENLGNVLGQHVSKRFADLIYEGVVASHDNASEMFKVVYTNGHSEEMRLEDLLKYLVPHEHPVHPDPNELPNKNDETGKFLAQIAPAPPTRKHRTKKMSSGSWGKGVVDSIRPPRQGGRGALWRSTRNNETSRGLRHSTKTGETSEIMKLRRSTRNDETLKMIELQHSAGNDETSGTMKLRSSTRKTETWGMMELRRSTRKRKQVLYNYCEETTDEDEYEEDEPNYPLPPIIQVPWADGGEENSEPVATKGRIPPQDRRKGVHTRKLWASLRMCASAYPGDGPKVASDESE